jgi:hypothetical protein
MTMRLDRNQVQPSQAQIEAAAWEVLWLYADVRFEPLAASQDQLATKEYGLVYLAAMLKVKPSEIRSLAGIPSDQLGQAEAALRARVVDELRSSWEVFCEVARRRLLEPGARLEGVSMDTLEAFGDHQRMAWWRHVLVRAQQKGLIDGVNTAIRTFGNDPQVETLARVLGAKQDLITRLMWSSGAAPVTGDQLTGLEDKALAWLRMSRDVFRVSLERAQEAERQTYRQQQRDELRLQVEAVQQEHLRLTEERRAWLNRPLTEILEELNTRLRETERRVGRLDRDRVLYEPIGASGN